MFPRALKPMLADLEKRFMFVNNTASSKFISTYLVATALDPRNKSFLNAEQLIIAKTRVLLEV
jgi:hypothetical protein